MAGCMVSKRPRGACVLLERMGRLGGPLISLLGLDLNLFVGCVFCHSHLTMPLAVDLGRTHWFLGHLYFGLWRCFQGRLAC